MLFEIIKKFDAKKPQEMLRGEERKTLLEGHILTRGAE